MSLGRAKIRVRLSRLLQVLGCISSLERLQTISLSDRQSRRHSSAIDESNSALLVSAIEAGAIESIFSNSTHLSRCRQCMQRCDLL